MKRWLKVADLMMAKHRFMSRSIGGKYVKDECDEFIENTAQDVDRVNNLLKNQETTEFVAVTIPEPVSILEIEGLVKDLNKMGIKVKKRHCQSRYDGRRKCAFCATRLKDEYLKMIEDKFEGYQIIKMPLFPTEIRGQRFFK